jgi:hypothetical protein
VFVNFAEAGCYEIANDSYKAKTSLISVEIIAFSRSTLLQGVSDYKLIIIRNLLLSNARITWPHANIVIYIILSSYRNLPIAVHICKTFRRMVQVFNLLHALLMID